MAATVALAIAVGACGDSESESGGGAAAASGEPIRIGILAGLTGDSSSLGVPYVNGAQMAAAELNADGGVDGRPVEVEVADNKTQPVAGVQAGLKLVRTGDIDSLLCSCFSTIFFPFANALAKEDMAVTNNASTTPEIRELPGTIITTIPTDDVLGTELAKFAYGLGYEEAGILSVNDPYGVAFRQVVNDAYTEAGGEVLFEIMVDGGLPNYRPEMQRIADSTAEALLLGTYTDDARLQFKQLSEAGWEGVAFKLYPSVTNLNEDPEADGRFFGVESTWLADENADWRQRYEEEYGEEPVIWSAIGYDAMMLNARGVAVAASDSAEDVRAGIVEAAASYEGPTGTLEFDDSFVRTNAPLAFFGVENNEYVQVDENGEPIAGR